MAGDIDIHEEAIVSAASAPDAGDLAAIVGEGGGAIHQYGSRVIIAAVPPDRAQAVEQYVPDATVTAEARAIPEAARSDLNVVEALGLEAFALRQSEEYAALKARRPLDGEPWDFEEGSAPDYPATEVPEAVETPTVVPFGTRLTGRVAVGIVIVEGPTNDLQLTDAERTSLVAEVQNGLTWLGSQGAQAVTWVYDIRRVALDVLPDPGDTSLWQQEARWRDPAMAQLGFEASAAGVVAYVESLRTNLDTNSAYCGFFTRYPLRVAAYASRLDGAYTVMYFPNDPWGIDNIDRTFAHETGHIFGAPDEYPDSGCECGGQFGFAKWPNANCMNCAPGGGVSCIMRSNTWAMCRHTGCHLGYDVEVPSVRELPQGPAAQAVRNAGLQPRVTGQQGPGAWVYSQSPKGGSLVGACSKVTLLLRTGPIP